MKRHILPVSLLLLFAPPSLLAQERWADSRLPVRAGLDVWLDAARQAEAVARAGRPALQAGQSLETWSDASGHGRDARQPVPAFRPTYQPDLVPGNPVVRFDGADDFLAIEGLGRQPRDVTIFLVAAPFSNLGGYRAFLSGAARGRNDYVTGLNIDQGHEGRDRFDRLNVEGAGFGGEQNLFAGERPFGTFHLLTVTAKRSEGVQAFVDGRRTGRRPRQDGTLDLDEVRLGCRYYNNGGGPAFESGFLDGCLAEVLVYGRALADTERGQVEEYLRAKHAGLFRLAAAAPSLPVHMLVPGFTVRELPVKVANLNALTYAPDGRLFALGYDGRIHVLRDTDGDGLEDTAVPFWDKPTLRTPIAFAWRPEGLYVVSNGKVSLFHEDPATGRADREDVIATGWVRDDGHTGGGVDALGLAFDAQNNLYFGLGCADFTNAYRLREGKSFYDLHSERGTIQKVSSDRKRRETVCTGIRFPYALAFNRAGDLFCTDQEGETWLPGGNPLDELNHIVVGRHYGFPPRHPTYLPGVINEPPVVGFGPQHQSTCGLVFNDEKPGRKAFGPKAWEGDALVAGWSRGKIWRVRLVKTPHGYVGRPTQIAALPFLTLNFAIAPSGDLVVCTHSGMPDWGNGPSGIGRLFKISYTGVAAPQPLFAWAAGPMEVRVAFDRELDAAQFDALKATIEYGEHIRAADRFEVMRPGYASVDAQMRAFRGRLHVTGMSLDDGRRTLVLTTDPHPARAAYALMLPGRTSTSPIDVSYDLTGVEGRWRDGAHAWSLWLPHLDLNVARELTRGSAGNAWLEKPQASGVLELRTALNLPRGRYHVHLRTRDVSPFLDEGAGLDYALGEAPPSGVFSKQRQVVVHSDGKPVPLTVLLKVTSSEAPDLQVSYHSNTDPTDRTLPLNSLLLPWAPPPPPPSPVRTEPPPELAGGDWKRGEAIFYGPQAHCATCHSVRGKGGTIGPDLSNLIARDAVSVLRDVTDPSAAINPDHVAYTALLQDGRLLTGVVRAERESRIRIVDAEARELVLNKGDIEELRPSPVSIMPQGYDKLLGPDGLRDVVTFLTAPAPQEPPGRPGPRSRAEVDAVLAAGEKAPTSNKEIHILLVASTKDHGPGEHDYPAWQRRWKDLLGKLPRVKVSTAFGWPEAAQWQTADVVVLYYWNHQWSPAQFQELDAYLARGGGLVALHSAVIHDKDPQALAQRLGIAGAPSLKFRHGPLDLDVTAPDREPITRGLKKVHFVDESYWNLVGEPSRVNVLATTVEEGKPRPMVWTYRPGKGRVFCCILGHYSWTFDDPLFRVLALRGMAWAAGEPVGRFEGIVTEGLTLP